MLLSMYYTDGYYTNSILWDKRVHLQVDQLSECSQQVVLVRQASDPVTVLYGVPTAERLKTLDMVYRIIPGLLFVCVSKLNTQHTIEVKLISSRE